jgi:tetratricopeptide (TPR) repeat protein
LTATKLDRDVLGQLDQQMQKGYSFAMKGDSKAAADVWLELWRNITETMGTYGIEFIEDMGKAFKGKESIFNWVMDFDTELLNAARDDKKYSQFLIDFCTAYIAKCRNKDEYNNLVLTRDMAEAYFKIGKTEQGEAIFQKYVDEHPKDGWGWINWSDQYGLFGEAGNRDFAKAIQILERGLEVDGLEDEMDALERLEDIYKELGETEKAEEVSLRIKEKSSRPKVYAWNNKDAAPSILPPKTMKIGRNDPCPCGSGKKYKKCCGRE